jgi:CBS domain-containing protein
MLPLEEIVVVTPSTPMEAALDRLGDGGREFVLVLNGPRAVGLLTVADVARWIRRHHALVA